MCGLAGIFEGDGRPADEGSLRRMLATIAHRGPDGEGIWARGPVALGHRRLAVLDVGPTSAQPMVTEDGLGALAYNGEVYNHEELRATLEGEGARFSSRGDAEVVLQALHRWGPAAAVRRFDGMFAFAYLDGRDGALWLGRDRLGIKPLVLARRGSRWLFASEIRALLAHPDVPPRPDERALSVLAYRARFDGRWTCFAGIEALPPGTLRRVTAAGVADDVWFRAIDALDVTRVVASTVGDRTAVDAFDGALRESVRRHLRCDVPRAALVSGGVDSGLIVAHARSFDPGIAGWVANVGGAWGEGGRAEAVARHVGVPLRRLEMERPDWLRLWPRSLRALEHPSPGLSDPPLLALLERMRDAGTKVVLSGEGSDELFGGYDRYEQTFRLWRRRARRGLWPWGRRRWRRRRQRMLDAPLATSPSRDDAGLRLEILCSLHAEADARVGSIFERLAPVRDEAERAVLAHTIADLNDSLAWWLLRHDRLGMAASVELRVPFLANALVDMGLNLPARLKLRRGVGKWVVKQAALRHLPRGIVLAEKRGFPTPEGWAAGTTALLRDGLVPDLLRWTPEVRDHLLPRIERTPALRTRLASMEVWARLFLRGDSDEEVADRLASVAAPPDVPPESPGADPGA